MAAKSLKDGEGIRFFPWLQSGLVWPAAEHARQLISVAWLIMTEGFAYVEDIQGAGESLDLLEVARLRFTELLLEMDVCFSGAMRLGNIHHLAFAVEYGLTNIADLNGPELVAALALAEPADPPRHQAQVENFFSALVAAFPGDLDNALLPQNQGRVLRALRMWEKLCRAAGTEPAFLSPLMRAL
jgi:hypothetical protein